MFCLASSVLHKQISRPWEGTLLEFESKLSGSYQCSALIFSPCLRLQQQPSWGHSPTQQLKGLWENTTQWTELDKSKPAAKQQQTRTCQLRSRLFTYTSNNQKNHGSGQNVSCYEMLHGGNKQQLTISAWCRPNVATEGRWVNQSPAAEEQSRWEAARSHTVPLLLVAILLQHPVNVKWAKWDCADWSRVFDHDTITYKSLCEWTVGKTTILCGSISLKHIHTFHEPKNGSNNTNHSHEHL